MKKLLFLLLLLGAATAQAQRDNADIREFPHRWKGNVRTPLRIPDIPGYRTLKCDFHTHTVFSDGTLWPDARVDEAWQDGLDAIAITDHIEYRPRQEILRGDLNESSRIARSRAQRIGMIVVAGTEITRNKPLGHLNALFISDANRIQAEDPLVSIDSALAQGAFIMWNHPGWPDNLSTFCEVHETLIRERKIHGVEIVNYVSLYPVTLDWCRQYGLTYLGNSDIHGPIVASYGNEHGVRPLTLVFSEQRSEEGIRQALFAGRSLVLFDNLLMGPPDYLKALTQASLQFTQVYTHPKGNRTFEVENRSQIEFRLRFDDRMIILPAGQVIRLDLPSEDREAEVINCLSAQNTPLKVTLPF